MRKAIIDIGTNSVRLLIADCDKNTIIPCKTDIAITRIGEGVDKSKKIGQVPLARSVQKVGEFVRIAYQLQAESIRITATSAVRDAQNKDEVSAAIQQHTGLQLEILAGETEAAMSYYGAIGDFLHLQGNLAVLDIGGGSTELVYVAADGLNCASVNIGAVRLQENPDLSSKINTILSQLLKKPLPEDLILLAVGGTATSLAAMEQQLTVYDSNKVHGCVLSLAIVQQWAQRLAAMSLEERENIIGLMKKRADIIPYGASILTQAMTVLGVSQVIISDKDLLYGLLMT